MQIQNMLSAIDAMRQERIGKKRAPKVKPGRELVKGVMHFNGSGGSEHTGTCSAPKLDRSLIAGGHAVTLVKSSDLPVNQRVARGGRKSRRVRRAQWVRE